MSNDEEPAESTDGVPPAAESADDDGRTADDAGPSDAELDAYDLDGDGKISMVESERARLGLIDARLEEIAAEDDGLKGKLADAAHRVLDEFDND